MEDIFPSRASLIDQKKTMVDSMVDQIKGLNIDEVDFEKSDFKPRHEIVESQKVYFWIRVFLKEEQSDLKPDDTIKIKYKYSNEELETKFICFAKAGLDKDSGFNVASYNEDDTKVLCLMIDSARVNDNSEDIPFIRTLFKNSRHYDYALLKVGDLILTNDRTSSTLDYYDIAF